MGRGKVELKRIENKVNRQVTFSKRRSGLLKKAREISVLCDADLALVIFSSKGRLFEMATDSGMETILDRYERYSSAQRQFCPSSSASDRTQGISRCSSSSDEEFPKLVNRIEILQKTLRNTLGEDIDKMGTRELQNLEQQIEIGLKRIRTRKNQVLNETISDLHKKTKALQETNNIIVKKMKESGSGSDKSDQQDDNVAPVSSNLLTKVSAPRPLLPSPTTNGDSQASEVIEENNEAQAPTTLYNLMPRWMLNHMSNQ